MSILIAAVHRFSDSTTTATGRPDAQLHPRFLTLRDSPLLAPARNMLRDLHVLFHQESRDFQDYFQTSGFDTEVNFRLDLEDLGRIKSRLLLTWITEFKRPAAPGAPIFDALGFVNQPEKLFNWSNNWSRGPWSVDVRWNYVGGYDARSDNHQRTAAANPPPNRVQTFRLRSKGLFPRKHRVRAAAPMRRTGAALQSLESRGLQNRTTATVSH